MWLGVSPTSSASAVWLPAIAAAFSIVFFNDIRHSIGLDLNCPYVAKIWAIVTTYGQIPYVDIFPPHEGTHAILFSHPCQSNSQFGWCLGRADRAGVHPSICLHVHGHRGMWKCFVWNKHPLKAGRWHSWVHRRSDSFGQGRLSPSFVVLQHAVPDSGPQQCVCRPAGADSPDEGER